ncbi:helix-turn-helix transcriptional regulator [Pseudonocardia saturnea]
MHPGQLRTALVGRERELTELTDRLSDALDGRPGVVVCSGEPGIGKTRLAEELAAVAADRGATVAWGCAVEAAGAPPYWPWWQILRAVGRDGDLTAAAAELGVTADLARLAPDLFAGSAGDRGRDPSAEDRFRMFDAVTRLLRRVARDRPLLVVLDDAQWADPASLLLLAHVARSLDGERMLVVVNHRDTGSLPAVLVTDLPRLPATRRLEVRGLPTAAVGRQLTALVGRELAPDDVERVRARTGGNPYFVGEVARTLADGRAGATDPAVTSSVREAIGARLGRLPAEAVRLLQAAAIAGREFEVLVVATMLDAPPLDCLTALDAATAEGLVEPGAVPGRHRFVHDLVRDAVEAGLGSTERIRLHRLAAAAVEACFADRLEPHLAELARHWSIASGASASASGAGTGERARAAAWIRRAADEAMRRLAYEEAARLHRSALDVGAGGLADVDRCELLLAAGEALRQAGEVPERFAACREAAALARGLGRPDLLAAAAAALEGGDGGPEYGLVVRGMCEEALDALGPDPTALRARVLAGLSDVDMYLGDVDAAEGASAQALTVARQCGDGAALAAALRARQLVCSGPDGLAERADIAERMAALGRTLRDRAVALWAHLWRIDVAFQRGDLAAVARELDPLAWCAGEVRGPVARWHLLQCRAVLAQAQARFADARSLADQALAALPPTATGHGSAVVNRDGLLFTVALHAGGRTDGFDVATAVLADPGGDDVAPIAHVIFSVAAAYQLVAAGRLAEARTLYRRPGPPRAWRPIPHARTVCFAFGIRTAMALDLHDDVATLRERLEPYRGQHVVSGAGCVAYNGPVELHLGAAARHLGLLDDAVADLETAARACAGNGAAGFHVEARYELAVALAARGAPGDRVRAHALAVDVAKQAAALGMAPFVGTATRLHERLDDDPLTPREREVAVLVAQGLTNREIAGRLYLSERTAQNHVQHILTKLGLPNRAQVAVWVTARGMSTPAE